MNIDYSLIEKIHHQILPFKNEGKTASYIPTLKNADPDKFAFCAYSMEGETVLYGDYTEKYSIQSVSKVLTLAMAMKLVKKDIWNRVGREPSGNPFNSLIQLEHENGIPRNPFINAGALVITDILYSHFEKPKEAILDFVREITGNSDIFYDEQIAIEEFETGFRNRAVINFIKSYGNIKNEPLEILDLYYHHCALMMTTLDVAKSFSFLANHGKIPFSGKEIITPSQAKRLNALMLTCGFYDESGEFAYRVGLPGKSGVSGAIAAVVPQKWSVAVWSPRLNSYGNSIMGFETLVKLTSETGYSIF